MLERLFARLRRPSRATTVAAPESRSVAQLCAHGERLRAEGRTAQAIGAFALALEADSDCRSAHVALAALYRVAGDAGRAAEHALRAARLGPSDRDRTLSAASFLRDAQRAAEALELLQSIDVPSPAEAGVAMLRAGLLKDVGRYDEAIGLLEVLLQASPEHAPGLHALGGLYAECGLPEQAQAMYARQAALLPDSPAAASALLLCAQYRDHDRSILFRSHLDWGARFGAPSAEPPAFLNARDPERRINIGYVSADFNYSAAAFFIEPVLRHHDAARFQVTCYHASRRRDGLTGRLRSHIERWRDVDQLDDQALCAQVRADGIDILVDLNGHTRGNRLTVFALKPAPVQATYLGYGATTGLRTIDYRITDTRIDPIDEDGRCYLERLVRMPDSMWCFEPFRAAPAVGPLPAASNGFVTFGSMNNFSKVSADVLDVWAGILAALPDSRLMLLAAPPGATRERVRAAFAARGVGGARLTFFGRLPLEAYLGLHGSVDIALDPFPYTGGATTCSALWMGVPVLTLTGAGALARSGYSILASVGLEQWITRSAADYAARAVEFANDPASLAQTRAGMRERLANSPLLRGREFTAQLEQRYRSMWRDWCASQRTDQAAGARQGVLARGA